MYLMIVFGIKIPLNIALLWHFLHKKYTQRSNLNILKLCGRLNQSYKPLKPHRKRASMNKLNLINQFARFDINHISKLIKSSTFMTAK